jgi:hypothetical protein
VPPWRPHGVPMVSHGVQSAASPLFPGVQDPHPPARGWEHACWAHDLLALYAAVVVVRLSVVAVAGSLSTLATCTTPAARQTTHGPPCPLTGTDQTAKSVRLRPRRACEAPPVSEQSGVSSWVSQKWEYPPPLLLNRARTCRLPSFRMRRPSPTGKAAVRR